MRQQRHSAEQRWTGQTTEIPSRSSNKNSSKLAKNYRLFRDILTSAIMNDLTRTFTSRLKMDVKCVYQQSNWIREAIFFGGVPTFICIL